MKKLLTCALTFALIICGCIMAGCSLVWEPYIQVNGLKVEYQIGDSLDLSSAKVYYYKEQGAPAHSEADLEESMITGFSTEEPGTFTMVVSFEGLTLDISYTVKGQADQGGNNDQGGDQDGTDGDQGDEGGQESVIPNGAINEQQAEEVLLQAIAKMHTYAEIYQKTTNLVDNGEDQLIGYQVTTANASYGWEFSGDFDTNKWLIYEDGDYYIYEAAPSEDFTPTLTYNKYTISDQISDVRTYMYTLETLFTSNFVFDEASKDNNNYTLKYSYANELLEGISLNMEIKIENNEIKAIYNSVYYEGACVQTAVMEYTYYNELTTTIPTIESVYPSVVWNNAGEYIF